jgi:hypothetical protein
MENVDINGRDSLRLEEDLDGVVVALEGCVVQRGPAAEVGFVNFASFPDKERDETRLKQDLGLN